MEAAGVRDARQGARSARDSGELRVRWLGDGPENLLRLSELLLAREEDGAGPQPPLRRRVIAARPGRAEEVRICLEGVAGCDEAEALRGLWVLAEGAALGAPEDGGHYWFELIGCRVLLPDGNRSARCASCGRRELMTSSWWRERTASDT